MNYFFLKTILSIYCTLIAICFSAHCKKPGEQLNFHEKLNSSLRILILSKYSFDELSVSGSDLSIHVEPENIYFKNNEVLRIRKNTLNWSVKAKTLHLKNRSFSVRSPSLMSLKFTSNGKIISHDYSGEIEFNIHENKFQIINIVDAETYIHNTMISESSNLIEMLPQNSRTRSEFTETMKIVIRSFVHKNRGRHANESADLCDLTHCMSFSGIRKIPELQKAVLLTYRGGIVDAYFHSTCGGTLSGPEVFWSNIQLSSIYKKSEDNDIFGNVHCRFSPHYKWQASLSKSTMEKITGLANIRSVELQYKENRISGLKVSNPDKKTPVFIGIQAFLSETGRLLGWNVIKSNYFTIADRGDYFYFEGKGLGHGIGLCQWGAFQMAKEGSSSKDILKFYFPGAELSEAEYFQ